MREEWEREEWECWWSGMGEEGGVGWGRREEGEGGGRREEWGCWSCASFFLQVGLCPGVNRLAVGLALTVDHSYWSPPLHHRCWPAIPDWVSTQEILCDIYCQYLCMTMDQ